ncbi:replication restart DNA helicase PriA [Clostridium cavendishii DSM 21758]|uniref:Replication restart protein PriA n=1 Tax=Clostridium cavendishii DSM 21758 TaxID=1121302 RepID=A0A1M6KA71_9CLOT|nr:primosomal protein N' [Clostridium cavendishii]SHJ55820.1 replication restart DNA helicase PriA [Clostridium cavendishii DSM 21758]
MAEYAGIIINNDSVQVDKPFTYKIKEEFKSNISLGHRVKVPFGKGNRQVEGFVIELYDSLNKSNDFRMKSISSLIDNEPILTDNDLKLILFMRKRYLCKYIDAIRVMIPPGIMRGGREKTKSSVFFVLKDKGLLRENYSKALDIIEKNSGLYTKTELNKFYNISMYTINKLQEKGFVEIKDVQVQRVDNRVFENYEKRILNEEQTLALNKIVNSQYRVFLLKGVTGSGKTEIYMNLVEKTIKNNKSALILVPEIALTPQMIERFKGRFGPDVAVFHSRLSDGERFDEWFRVKEGRVKLVIGARSAIFLPFKDLGLIVIDEEHEATYKSEMSPRYNTKEIAEYKSILNSCKVILGSATPSVESYYRALNEEIELVEIKKRANAKAMPDMHIVDMREELRVQNKSMFSRLLYSKIDDRLKKGEQIILFLNRRGFSSFVSCRKCGFVFKCKHCDVAMTYHNNGFLTCHYCGVSEKIRKTCPSCGSIYVKHFGTGTEKVENEIKRLFSNARVLRMDVDTTRSKNSFEKIYNDFKNKQADILIGTQMISKGLDFENVSLVGVIAADMSINMPDYKASERSFQLITQVSGRAGRGEIGGDVIIQTYNPENYTLNYIKNNDYEGFLREELPLRKAMNYPPFSKLLLIGISSKFENELIDFAKKLGSELSSLLEDYGNLEILGPCPCAIQKIKEMYRWQILIKGEVNEIIANIIKERVYDFSKDVYNNIRIILDVNPNSLI